MHAAKKTLRSGLWLILMLALSGCAFGTRQPTLVYPPAQEADEKTTASAASPVTVKRTTVVLENFRDERTDKSVVGTVRNGFGMRTADVVPTDSVADWVTQAVGSELRSSGYKVVSGSVSDTVPSESVRVSGDVLNVFCDMYMSYTGQVSVLTTVRTGSGEVFTKHYAGEGSAGLAFAATGESYAQSLALALRSALRKFVADLDAKLAGK